MSIKIALAGNPNCGKTTMFNELTGASQYVGNWPGVTVEKKEGKLKAKLKPNSYKKEEVIITDLPGIYSLSPYTLEEVVSRDYLIKEKPDCIINLVDATNLERNLYLSTQLMELGIPVVIALNMYDLIKKSGESMNIKELSEIFASPIIPTSALKGEGLNEVVELAIKKASEKKEQRYISFTKEVEEALSEIENIIEGKVEEKLLRWHAIKLFERDQKEMESLKLEGSMAANIEKLIKELEAKKDDDSLSIITDERYRFITENVKKNVKKPSEKLSFSDRVDRIVTDRVLGLPIFLGIMYLVYYITIELGTIATDWTNDVFVAEWLQGGVEGFLSGQGANPILIDAIVNGAIAGVGAILGFMPQMAILFVLMAMLEDIGYMARIAFVMDRVFRYFGLSGKSIIPLIVSSGCGIPGIMATKTIENDNDRRLTIITTTNVPCGAKLPVIVLFAGMIMDGDPTFTFLMYVIGVLSILVSSVMLKKFKSFHGVAAPFVMELPSYHLPQAKTVFIHVWEKLKGFFIKAGTIIFLVSVVMWLLSTYGFYTPEATAEEANPKSEFGIVENIEDSILADVGGVIAPVFKPLGFDNFQAVSATFTGLMAKELIVSTMAVLGDAENVEVAPAADKPKEEVADAPSEGEAVEEGEAEEHDFEDPEDEKNILATKSFLPTSLIALSFLLFNLLCSPCLAAVGTMAKELNDRKMFWFGVLWQNGFAYVVSFLVYQLGLLMMGGSFSLTSGIAVIVLLGFLYLLFRKDPYKGQVVAKRSVM